MIRLIRSCVTEVTPEDLPDESVHLAIMSPPYKDPDGYSDELIVRLGALVNRVLAPGGRVFFNFGQLRDDYAKPFRAASAMIVGSREGCVIPLRFGQTINWVKSLAIDGVQQGHYQPIRSDHVLNYGWEYVFTFWKPLPGCVEPKLDRLSIGVPFADKGNLRRGTRGKHGDLHCAGDVWFIPYSTTGKSKKKAHEHSFPEELVRRCIAVSGVPEGSTVLDPFSGGGTTAAVARRLGMNAVAIDRDNRALVTTLRRWRGVSEPAQHQGDPRWTKVSERAFEVRW